MNKRLILGIVIGSLVGLFVLFIVYILFFAKDSDKPTGLTDVFKSFFPYGQTEDISGTSTDIELFPETIPTNSLSIPRLRQISSEPVAGFVTYERKATSTDSETGSSTMVVETAIRYIEVATGHVYETSDRSTDSNRLSITTIPKLTEVIFNSPNSLVARRFDSEAGSIQTFVGSLVPISSTSSTTTDNYLVKGTYLSPDITEIATFGNKLFSLYTSDTGSSGFLTSPIGSKESRVFSSQLASWLVSFANENNLIFTNKASGGYPGNAFLFNITSRSLTKLLGPINGLTFISNSTLDKFIYTESNQNSFNTYYKDIKNNMFLQLSSTTLPEKCIWSKKNSSIVYCAVPESIPSGRYPDDWYKGIVSFTDSLVMIDLSTNTETELISLQTESGQSIDAISLGLDSREGYLYFRNKQDYRLWSFDLDY